MKGKVINDRRKERTYKNFFPPLAPLFATLIFLMLNTTFTVAQNADTMMFADSKATTLKFLTSEAIVEKQQMENAQFIEQFKIDLRMCKEAKVLEKNRMKDNPNMEKANDVANVNKGNIVKVYKYCRRHHCWAVKHKNKWGFLPESALQMFDEN